MKCESMWVILYTKNNMFLNQHLCSTWNKVLINQSDLRDKL